MLIPKVRFPQYTDEWGNKPLLQLVLDMNGGAPLSPDDILDSGDYKIIPKKAIQAGGKIVIDDECSYVTQDVYEKYKASHIDKSHTLVVLRDLVPTGPSIGYVVENDKVDEGILAQGVYGMHFKEELCPRYFIQYSNTPQYRKLMQTIMVGSTQVHIRNTTYLEIDIPLPSLPEQQKIADFLSNVDEVIAASEEEVANLERQKKAVMQKIFSQEVRFKKEDGSDFPDWEEKKLGEVCECLDNVRKPITKGNRKSGPYPYYGSTNIQDYVEGFLFDEPLVLLAEDAGPFMDFWNKPIAQWAEGKFWVNNHAHVLRPREHRKFMFYSLEHKDIRTYINNPERGKLNQEEMVKIPVAMPHPDEQKLIADFFTSFDEAITAAKQELAKWKELKKGLLQQMFV